MGNDAEGQQLTDEQGKPIEMDGKSQKNGHQNMMFSGRSHIRFYDNATIKHCVWLCKQGDQKLHTWDTTTTGSDWSRGSEVGEGPRTRRSSLLIE